MGCDIHIFCEKKSGDKWVQADFYGKDAWGDNGLREVLPYRDYEAFYALAGVRGRERERMISEPRGIPSDCSPEILKEKEEWGVVGHSYSWLTLEEVRNFIASSPGDIRSNVLYPMFCRIVERYDGWLTPETLGNKAYNDFRIVFWFDS